MKTIIKATILAFLVGITLFFACSQEEDFMDDKSVAAKSSPECAFELTESDVISLENSAKTINDYQRTSSEVRDVPVNLVVVRRDDGTGGVSDQGILDAFEIVNEIYEPAGMNFVLCKINIVNDSDRYDGSSSDQASLRNEYGIEKKVNLYVMGDAQISGNSYCGFAYYPGGPESVYLAASCFVNGSTLSHEIGHHFGLIHTHGNSNTTNSTYELADGSNGATTGDYVQDTPSDPKLSGQVNGSTCSYYGSYRDRNGEPHDPDPTNIMSYSTKACRDYFSPGQIARLNSVFNGNTNRSYSYLESCDGEATPPPPNGSKDNPFIIESPMTKNISYGGYSCGSNQPEKYYLVPGDLNMNNFTLTFLGSTKRLTIKGDVFGSTGSLLKASTCAEICVEGKIWAFNVAEESGGIITEYCGTSPPPPPPLGSEDNPIIIEDLVGHKMYANGDETTNNETIYYKVDGDLDVDRFKLRMRGQVKLEITGNVNGTNDGKIASQKGAEICVLGKVNVLSGQWKGGTINKDCGTPLGTVNHPIIIKPNFNKNRTLKNGNCDTQNTKHCVILGDLDLKGFKYTVKGRVNLTIKGNAIGVSPSELSSQKCAVVNVEGNISVATSTSSEGVINN
jgi:hypothetical protein